MTCFFSLNKVKKPPQNEQSHFTDHAVARSLWSCKLILFLKDATALIVVCITSYNTDVT